MELSKQEFLEKRRAYLAEIYAEERKLPIEERIARSKQRQEEEKAARLAERKKIRKYCNQLHYTDVTPWEVVRVISDITVEIRRMDTKQIKFPSNFEPGGFVGHFHDNRSGQDYEYISNPENETIRIRWSKRGFWANGRYNRFSMADKPYKFYDYNF